MDDTDSSDILLKNGSIGLISITLSIKDNIVDLLAPLFLILISNAILRNVYFNSSV